jgi:hypothetical protein
MEDTKELMEMLGLRIWYRARAYQPPRGQTVAQWLHELAVEVIDDWLHKRNRADDGPWLTSQYPNPMTSLPVPIVAALIGAAAATLPVLLTQMLIVRRQHIRLQRAALLQRQLAEAYAPLDYWLSVLASMECSDEARHKSWSEIREILIHHGYLISPAIRSDLYRLSSSRDPDRELSQMYVRFNTEYQVLVDAYYKDHFQRILSRAHARINPPEGRLKLDFLKRLGRVGGET